MEVIIQMY